MPGLALLFAPLMLAGCSTIGSVTGAIAGAAAGTTSANPAVGYAVGIGSKAAADAVLRSLSRKRHRREQDQIALAIGVLRPGETAPWAIKHRLPLAGSAHGSVTVVRDIPNALAPCKEVVLTVVAGTRAASRRHNYITTACQQGAVWKWAMAEPAAERWRFLH